MHYHEYLPSHPQLRQFIDAFWTISFDQSNFRQNDIVMPDGGVEWIFNLGDYYFRQSHDGFQKSTCSQLIGHRTKAVKIKQSATIQLFAIRFKPYGLAMIGFKENAAIVDQVIQDSRLFDGLEEHVLAIIGQQNKSIIERIAHLETHLLSLFKISAVPKVLTKSWHLILNQKGQVNIQKMCIDFGISKSQLNRTFKQYVGIGPKKLADIIKLNQLINRLNCNSSLTELCYYMNFFDQAHMIRFFKKYTGYTPSQFCSQNYLLPDTLLKTKALRNCTN